MLRKTKICSLERILFRLGSVLLAWGGAWAVQPRTGHADHCPRTDLPTSARTRTERTSAPGHHPRANPGPQRVAQAMIFMLGTL